LHSVKIFVENVSFEGTIKILTNKIGLREIYVYFENDICL